MNIDVKREHIDAGIRGSSTSCPVALALIEATGKSFAVNKTRVTDGCGKWYRLPPEAVDFIDNFDYRRFVEPFSFELDV